MILTQQDIHIGLVYKYITAPNNKPPYMITKVNREHTPPNLEVLNLTCLEAVSNVRLEQLLLDLNNNKVVLYTQKESSIFMRDTFKQLQEYSAELLERLTVQEKYATEYGRKVLQIEEFMRVTN